MTINAPPRNTDRVQYEYNTGVFFPKIPMSCCDGSSLGKVSGILVLVGALNWGLVGLGGFMGQDWNLVAGLLGAWPQVEWLVYLLVGLSGLYMLKSYCGSCGTK